MGMTYERFEEKFNNLSTDTQLEIAFNYWNENGNGDEWKSMDSFDEIMGGSEPLWIAQRVFYGDFCPAHNYFKFDGNGNLESSDFASDVLNDIDIEDVFNCSSCWDGYTEEDYEDEDNEDC